MKRKKWPFNIEYGSMIRSSNNSKGDLHRACQNIKVMIGNVIYEQHFFVQNMFAYPIILEHYCYVNGDKDYE